MRMGEVVKRSRHQRLPTLWCRKREIKKNETHTECGPVVRRQSYGKWPITASKTSTPKGRDVASRESQSYRSLLDEIHRRKINEVVPNHKIACVKACGAGEGATPKGLYWNDLIVNRQNYRTQEILEVSGCLKRSQKLQ